MIDTHCHIHYYDNYKEILEEFPNCVCIFDLEEIRNKYEVWDYLSQKTYVTIGIHPNQVQNESLDELEMLINKYHDRLIGIGETGIDLHYSTEETLNTQILYFKKHIDLCRKYDKTLIVHGRNCSIETLLAIIPSDIRCILHSFNFHLDDAKKVPENIYLSLSGMVTFKSCDYLREVIRHIPLSKLLCETDSPYLTPIPFRGKQNYPKYVKYIYQAISEIKQISIDTVIQQIHTNFHTIFNI